MKPSAAALLHIIERRVVGDDDDLGAKGKAAPVAAAHLRKIFEGPIIVAGGFTGASAEAILLRGDADAVAFGRLFASNPDLVARLRQVKPLSKYDRDTFYGGDRRGYTDYPSMADEAVAA